MLDCNKGAASHFGTLVALYTKNKQPFKASTFRKVQDAIDKLDVEVCPEAIKGIPGIGASSINELTEYLDKGTSERLEDLKSQVGDEQTNIAVLIEDLKAKGIPASKLLVWKAKFRVETPDDFRKLSENESIEPQYRKILSEI